MKSCMAYRILVISTVHLTATASCGANPPPFGFDESDSSISSTDSGWDSDTESHSDTETGSESDSSCFDSSGHDEDGDNVLDFCDNCPSVANGKQANGDDDDLGDACEASGRPEVLDRIVVFDPFTEQGSDWDADKGEWSWLSDMVQGSAPGGSGEIAGLYMHKAPLGSGAFAVEATFYHDQSGTSLLSPFTGVVFSWSQKDLSARFWICGYGWDGKALSLWRVVDGNLQVSVRRENVDTSNGDPAIWRRVRAIWDDGVGLRCEFGNEIGDSYSVSAPQEHIWQDMSGQAGLRVYNEISSFSSFVIYN